VALKERLSKMASQMQSGKDPKMLVLYSRLLRELAFKKSLEMLLKTAPESMDPKKVQEHWRATTIIIKESAVAFNDNAKEIIRTAHKRFSAYVPQNVSDYKSQYKGFVIALIKTQEEKNGEQ
jgi:hypothetical protein